MSSANGLAVAGHMSRIQLHIVCDSFRASRFTAASEQVSAAICGLGHIASAFKSSREGGRGGGFVWVFFVKFSAAAGIRWEELCLTPQPSCEFELENTGRVMQMGKVSIVTSVCVCV